MKTLFIYFSILSLFVLAPHSSFAQNRRATGMLQDDARYNNLSELPYNQIAGTSKADNTYSSQSLRKYCPTPKNQENIPSCVGWAIGYGAMTITRAAQENITDRAQLDKMAHSALYLYNKIKLDNDCYKGAFPVEGLEKAKQEGVCRASKFDNVPLNCGKIVSTDADNDAYNFRIKDYKAIFHNTTSNTDIKKRIRAMIDEKNPIVIGLKTTNSFHRITDGQKLWAPPANDTVVNLHAMVLIGYDRQDHTFELMNSWGSSWGDGGFIKVNEDDLLRYLMYGFCLILEENKPSTQMTGAFAFRVPNGYSEANGTRTPRFRDVPAQFNTERKVYELIEKDWKADESIFQAVTNHVPKGKFIYIFSIDAKDKVEMHFPLHTKDYASFMPSADTEIVVPSTDQAMMLTEKGDDNLCILYADKAIDNFASRFEKIKTQRGSIHERIKASFGDVLADQSKVKYNPSNMSFEATLKTGEPSVVQMVLTVKAL